MKKLVSFMLTCISLLHGMTIDLSTPTGEKVLVNRQILRSKTIEDMCGDAGSATAVPVPFCAETIRNVQKLAQGNIEYQLRQFESLSLKDILEILQVADFLNIQPVMDACFEYIINGLNDMAVRPQIVSELTNLPDDDVPYTQTRAVCAKLVADHLWKKLQIQHVDVENMPETIDSPNYVHTINDIYSIIFDSEGTPSIIRCKNGKPTVALTLDNVEDYEWNDNGTILAIVFKDKKHEICLFDLTQSIIKRSWTIEAEGEVGELFLSPSGDQLAYTMPDKKLHVDFIHMHQLHEKPRGSSISVGAEIEEVHFTPQGLLIETKYFVEHRDIGKIIKRVYGAIYDSKLDKSSGCIYILAEDGMHIYNPKDLSTRHHPFILEEASIDTISGDGTLVTITSSPTTLSQLIDPRNQALRNALPAEQRTILEQADEEDLTVLLEMPGEEQAAMLEFVGFSISTQSETYILDLPNNLITAPTEDEKAQDTSLPGTMQLISQHNPTNNQNSWQLPTKVALPLSLEGLICLHAVQTYCVTYLYEDIKALYEELPAQEKLCIKTYCTPGIVQALEVLERPLPEPRSTFHQDFTHWHTPEDIFSMHRPRSIREGIRRLLASNTIHRAGLLAGGALAAVALHHAGPRIMQSAQMAVDYNRQTVSSIASNPLKTGAFFALSGLIGGIEYYMLRYHQYRIINAADNLASHALRAPRYLYSTLHRYLPSFIMPREAVYGEPTRFVPRAAEFAEATRSAPTQPIPQIRERTRRGN